MSMISTNTTNPPLLDHSSGRTSAGNMFTLSSLHPGSPSENPQIARINLNRIVSRLEHTVLLDPSPQLRRDPFTRARVRANIEHARKLLLDVEHSALSLSRVEKTTLQTDLQKKRELVTRMNERLHELDQVQEPESPDSADSEDEDEDNFPSYAPHRAADAGLEISTSSGEGNEALQNAARGLTNELRRRGGAQDADVTATGNSLFPSKPKTSTGEPSHAQTDAILSNHRSEQESLETSLLDMAARLKEQSLSFRQVLEGDNDVIARASAEMDRNAQGMTIVGQTMGTVRRMAEGKGMWDRLKLYAMIFGLWVMAFLIFFMGPKIRF